MYDCSFGNSFKIQCSANQSITCDPVTYGRLVDSAFTVLDTTPTLLQRPVILYQAQIGLLNGAVIPAASVTPFDLGGMSSPSALPGGLAQVSFLGSPNATAACVGAVIDGSGHVIVSVLNTSDVLTTAVENDQEFVVFYQPAELLA
jgi:hypothetical protein